MSEWQGWELRLLREEIAKGKAADLGILAIELGRSKAALLAQAVRRGYRRLDTAAIIEPGVSCERCGASFLWVNTPTDEAALLRFLADWRAEHIRCAPKSGQR